MAPEYAAAIVDALHTMNAVLLSIAISLGVIAAVLCFHDWRK